MPDGTHTTVQLLDSASVAELLEKCCSKRKFDPDQFHLEFVEDQEEVPESLLVSQLRERAVELVANSAVAGLDTYMSDNKLSDGLFCGSVLTFSSRVCFFSFLFLCACACSCVF